MRKTMENKNEKSMTLEEMIGEMLKDAKVVKVPLPVRAEEKTEVQKQDKPMPARPSSVPVLSLNIENLHVHMDERMTSYNYGFGQEPDAEADDPVEDIDFDEMLERIHKESAAVPRLYRIKFGRDIYKDLRQLEKSVGENDEDNSNLDLFSLEMFEDLAWLMARHADPAKVPDSPEEFLDQFNTFSIYQILPQLIELWGLNVQTEVESRKNLAKVSGK